MSKQKERQERRRQRVKKEEIIHSGVECKDCGMCPIVGMRYKCSVRMAYDLC